jgi:multiple sugar transport system ATP-binding protein
MNLLEGTLKKAGNSWIVDHGSEQVTVPRHIDGSALREGQRVLLGIRPEAVHLAAEVAHDARIDQAWEFDRVVDVTEPTGPATLALFEIDGTAFHASLSGDADVDAGKSYRFKADLAKALLFDAQSGERVTHVDERALTGDTQAA